LAIANPHRQNPILSSMTHSNEDATRVRVLSEALPYIQKFAGRTVVVKYGGAAMKDGSLKDRVIRDLVFMSCVGIRPVLVHGGGPEINSWLEKLGIEPQFKDGLRVTDAATMDVVEMVLVGRVNKEIVSLIDRSGGNAVGLCGKDGNLIVARPDGREGIGFVGEVSSVNVNILNTLVKSGYIPVVSSVAADENGQAYNINADTVAGEIAAALGAEKLILMTDTPGLMRNFKDPTTLIRQLDISGARGLIEDGTVSGGMIPKLTCCVRSLAQGVKAAHIIDGRLPHSLLLEIFTDNGTGSMIVSSASG
jgi:acetylglutamate kinase